MTIVAYGLSHKTAPIALRERVTLEGDALRAALLDLRAQHASVSEVAILSTCNRTELYCVLNDHNDEPLRHWLAQSRRIRLPELTAATYSHWDLQAARHLARVACGLDSLVLGEPQVLGQLKDACDIARDVGTFGSTLERFTQNAFSIAKKVRSSTDIGRNPISVAYVAVSLAAQIFSDLRDATALLLGAGDTIELVARHLRERGVNKIVIANRTLSTARELANEVGGEAIALADMPRHLHFADIIFSSTASALPILGKGAVEQALRKRKHKPMFMVDIAVPRDIEPEVGELRDVYLYSVDDLTAIVEDNVRGRKRAAEQAEIVIEEGIDNFVRDTRVRDGQDTVKALRRQAEAVRDAEIARALSELERGGDPAEVLRRLGTSLTNKLIHRPTVALRDASANEHDEVIRMVSQMFALEPPPK